MNPSEDRSREQVRDPVCGMPVDPGARQVEYRHMRFAFCSDQCRERFLANPGLYVGVPGTRAPKQEQQVVMKTRCIPLESPLPTPVKARLEEALRAMMGVEEVRVDDRMLEVRYDLLQATARQIEETVLRVGAELDDRWRERIRRGFIHFIEEERLASMEVQPPGGGHGH